jgi:hypothetical protein
MSENNRLTRYAIKTLTFMSEFCQVAVVGEGRERPCLNRSTMVLRLHLAPTAIGSQPPAAVTSAQGKTP